MMIFFVVDEKTDDFFFLYRTIYIGILLKRVRNQCPTFFFEANALLLTGTTMHIQYSSEQ